MNEANTNNSTHGSDGLCGLYYPETICLDEVQLKYLLLIYDKLFFLPVDIHLNPGHTSLSKRFSINDALLTGAYKTKSDAHFSLMYCSESNAWNDRMKKLMEFYDEFEENEFFVGLTEKKFSASNQLHPMKIAVDADMNDQQFVHKCNLAQNKKIFIPPIDASSIKGGGFSTRPHAYREQLFIPSICSERINTTLYMAGQHDCFPVTSSNLYTSLLNLKLHRVAENKASNHNVSRPQKISLLSWELITEIIPTDYIKSKTPQEIVRYKDAAGEAKERFRSQLFSLESMISDEPWDDLFQKELNALVKGKLMPEVRKVQDQKTEIWEKLFGQTIKSVTSLKVAPPVVGLQLVPGLSFWEILSLSASVIGSSVVPNLIDAWQEEKKLRRNALFFLANFNKE